MPAFAPPPVESLVEEPNVASPGFRPPPPESIVQERIPTFEPPPPEAIVDESPPVKAPGQPDAFRVPYSAQRNAPPVLSPPVTPSQNPDAGMYVAPNEPSVHINTLGENIALGAKLAGAKVADIAAEAYDNANPVSRRVPAGQIPFGGGNVQAVLRGEKTPIESAIGESGKETAELGGVPWREMMAGGSQSLSKALPKFAAMEAAGPGLLVQSIAAGGLFGIGDDGKFYPKQAAVAALLPGVGFGARYAVASAIGKSIVSGSTKFASPVAQKLMETIGEQAAMDAYMTATEAPELMDEYKQDPHKFWLSLAGIVGQNLGFAIMGAGKFHPDVPSEAQTWLKNESENQAAMLVTKKIIEDYPAPVLRDIYNRVNADDPSATDQEKGLVQFINSQLSKPASAIKRGATITTTERIAPDDMAEFWKKYLKVPQFSKTLEVKGDEENAPQNVSNTGRVPVQRGRAITLGQTPEGASPGDRLPSPAGEPAAEVASAKPPAEVPAKPAVGPLPTAQQLIDMPPQDFKAWAVRTGYTVGSPEKIAANLSADDIPKLIAVRDQLNKQVVDLTAKMKAEGPTEQGIADLQIASFKAGRLNEIASRIQPKPVPKGPDWLVHNIQQMNAEAERLGIADKIEELAAQRLTAGQIAQQLKVDPNVVRAVRSVRGIPSMTVGAMGAQSDNPEFETWLANRNKPETPKSSTQLTLPPHEAAPFTQFSQSIPDADVYHKADATGKEDYGIETQPHITVLYGLTKHEPAPVAKIVATKNPITVTLGKTSVFEGKDYDVLKVDVSGKDLHDLNSKISKLPNEQTHPTYQPHLTIAYLKKGEGKKYVGDTRFEGKKITFNSVTFSPPSEMRAAMGKPELPFQRPRVEVNLPVKDEKSGQTLVDGLNRSNPDLEAKAEKRGKKFVITVNGDAKESPPVTVIEAALAPVLPPKKPTATAPPVEGINEPTPVAAASKIEKRLDDLTPPTAKEVKSELVIRIEKAIEDSKSDSPDKPAFVTIDIPGDGTFKIGNTPQQLEEVLVRAKSISVKGSQKRGDTPLARMDTTNAGRSKQLDSEADTATKLYGGQDSAIRTLTRQRGTLIDNGESTEKVDDLLGRLWERKGHERQFAKEHLETTQEQVRQAEQTANLPDLPKTVSKKSRVSREVDKKQAKESLDRLRPVLERAKQSLSDASAAYDPLDAETSAMIEQQNRSKSATEGEAAGSFGVAPLTEFELAELGRLKLKREQGRKLTDGQKETLAALESRIPSEAHAMAAARAETAGQPEVAQASLSDESLGAANQRGGTGENPAEIYLRGNVSADPSLATGADGRRRQSEFLTKWAAENGALLTASPPANKQLETRTSEHYVVSDPTQQRVLKWTWPGTFGHTPIQKEQGLGREPSSPLQYLQRIRLQNSVFGDDIKVVGFQIFTDKGLMGRPGGLSIVTSQPFIGAANPDHPGPTRDEMWDYMIDHGFEPDAYGGEMGAWSRSDGVLVTDVRADNFIKTKAGLVPIDLQISQPNAPQGSVAEASPVDQPQQDYHAQSVEQLRAQLPHVGLSPQATSLLGAFLDSPLAKILPALQIKVADALQNGFQGSWFQGVIELARGADPVTGVHEFLHAAWDLFPDDIKAEFERLRVADLNKQIEEAEGHPERIKALTDLRDNPTTGGEDFMQRSYPVAIKGGMYPYSSAEEFFTHSGSERFKQRVGSMVEGFWARVKQIIGDFIAAIKKALRLRQNQREWLDNILRGNFEPADAETAARAEGERQASLTPEEQRAVQADIMGEAELGDAFVPTEVFGKKFGVRDRPKITDDTVAASSALAKQMLDDCGIPAVEQETSDTDPDGNHRGWIMQPQGHDMTPQGRMLVDRLKKEIAGQYEAKKTADHLANIINSIRLNVFVMPENGIPTAMEEMNPSVRLELGALAQSEASFRGQALNALRGYKKDLTVVGRNLDIELGRIWSDAFSGNTIRDLMDELAEAQKRGDDLQKALDDLLEKVDKKLKKTLGSTTSIGKKIISMVKAGPGEPWEILREIARKRWGTAPTDEQIAKVKATVNQAERLLKLTPQELAEAGGDKVKLENAIDDRRLATQARRTQLMAEVRLALARWTRPLNWKKYWETPQNNAAAINEYGVANVLFKAGFMGFRLGTHLSSQFFAVHIPTNVMATAQQNARDMTANGKHDYSLWKLTHEAFADQIKGFASSIWPAFRRFESAMAGRGPGRNVDELKTGIMLFERLQAQAEAYYKQGDYGRAAVTWIVGLPKFALRFLDGLDRMQGTAVELGELRHQIHQFMREQGVSNAQIEAQMGTIMSGLAEKRQLALADAARILQASGVPYTGAQLAESAWELVIGRMYQDLARIGAPADDFRAQNDFLMKTVAWQHPVRTGPGGLIAMGAKSVRGMLGKYGIPSFFLNFGNAIGTGLNYALQNTPLYATTAWQIPGYSHGESPHFAIEKDRLRRRWQALFGTIFGALILEGIHQGIIKVWAHAPTDKKERAIWEAQGHRVGTAEIRLNDHEVSVLSLTVGPGALLSPYLASGQAVYDAAERRHKAQEKMNAEAEKLGLTPGQVTPLDGTDMAAIFGEALWGTLMGNKALSAIIQSGSEYGVPNVKKMAASQVSPLIVGLPAFQEVMRGVGANLDPHLASFWDYLVPLPTSGARAVNMLGDPVGTPDSVQRMIQTMTAGSYPLVDLDQAKANPAYAALMASGYRPPVINPNHAYDINGEYRPFNDKELAAYTVARGTYLRQELADLGPDASPQAARQAYQRANAQALEDTGVTVTGRPSVGRGVTVAGGGQAIATAGVQPTPSALPGLPGGAGAVRTASPGRTTRPSGARVPARRIMGAASPSLRQGRGLHLPRVRFGRVPSLRRR